MDLSGGILISLLLPFVAVIILFVIPPEKRTFLVAGLFFLLSLLFIFSASEGIVASLSFDYIFYPFIFSAADPYSMLARVAFALTGAVSIAYAARIRNRSFELVALLAFSSAILVTFSEHFLTFFLFWEVLTISASALIFLKGDKHSYSMGWRYLLTHLSGGLLLFLGIMFHYQATGSMAVARPEAGLPFFVIAIGIKTAFVPMHYWLPAAYPAASYQGSVILSALTTKAGVYALARIIGPSLGIAYMGGVMAIFGVLMALLQKKMRSLLSYHIISQVGYMVAGIGVGLALSVDGGLLHLLNHMLYKGLLFMSAGAVIYATGTEHLKKLGGLWRKLPVAALSGMIGSLAIAGVPPFNGFISKTMLKYGTKDETLLWWLLMVAGVGTSLSFCKFMYFGFLRGDTGKVKDIKTVPWVMKAPMLITAGIIVLLGIFPGILGRLAPNQSSTFVYSTSTVRDGLIVALIGVAVFAIIKSFLDPARVTLPHHLLAAVNEQVNYRTGLVLATIKNVGRKENLINIGNAMWVLFFTITIILSGFLLRILFG